MLVNIKKRIKAADIEFTERTTLYLYNKTARVRFFLFLKFLDKIQLKLIF